MIIFYRNLQNRRYLPIESTLRKQTEGYLIKGKELRSPPAKESYKKLQKYHELADEVSMYVECSLTITFYCNHSTGVLAMHAWL